MRVRVASTCFLAHAGRLAMGVGGDAADRFHFGSRHASVLTVGARDRGAECGVGERSASRRTLGFWAVSGGHGDSGRACGGSSDPWPHGPSRASGEAGRVRRGRGPIVSACGRLLRAPVGSTSGGPRLAWPSARDCSESRLAGRFGHCAASAQEVASLVPLRPSSMAARNAPCAPSVDQQHIGPERLLNRRLRGARRRTRLRDGARGKRGGAWLAGSFDRLAPSLCFRGSLSVLQTQGPRPKSKAPIGHLHAVEPSHG